VTRETGNLLRDSVKPRPDTDSGDRPCNRVREAGSRWRLNRRRRTGGVSGSDTVDTTNGRRHNAGTAAARTAERGRDKARSLAATICQRRPSDQLTQSHRPQLESDARERQHVSPFTRRLRSTLSTAAAHTRMAARQLARPATPTHTLVHTISRPYTQSDSHSDSQSDNFVDDYWVTIIHPLSSAA